MPEQTFAGVVVEVTRTTHEVQRPLDRRADRRETLKVEILLDGHANLIPVSIECAPSELPTVVLGQRIALTFADPNDVGALEALNARSPEREAVRERELSRA